jgi:hypothetical protein
LLSSKKFALRKKINYIKLPFTRKYNLTGASMNRAKKFLSKIFSKMMQKEVRSSRSLPSASPPVAPARTKRLSSGKKTAAVKKTAKRTTPGTVGTRDAAPQHVHVENERWQKTLSKQNIESRKILVKHLAKKKAHQKVKNLPR